MKNSFTLFEVILTTLLASIITIGTLYYFKDLVSFGKKNFSNEMNNLDLQTTKIFLQKNSVNLNNNLSLNEDEKTLLYKSSILLKNVNSFNLNEYATFYEIDIVFENTNYKWVVLK